MSIQKMNCGKCNQQYCQCQNKKFQNDYGAHQKMVTKTRCGTPDCPPGQETMNAMRSMDHMKPMRNMHGHGQTMDSCCVQFICDTPIMNPSTGQYQMIKASLLEPVNMWMPHDEAAKWFATGKARECGAGEVPECQKGDPGSPGPRGIGGQPGQNGANGQAGPQGPMGQPGQNGTNGLPGQAGVPGGDGQSALVHAEYINPSLLIITTVNPGEEPKDLKINVPTCASVFEKMCECWDQVFAPACP